MVLVPPAAFDVVPRVRLMATIALVDLYIVATWISGSIRVACDRFRNHLEVHHIVARRRLVTLRTICRPRRRVLELGDGPLRRRVALRAIGPKEFHVPVLIRVTAGAIQNHLFGRDVLVLHSRPFRGAVLLDPSEKPGARISCSVISRVSFQIAQSELRQRKMIHIRRSPIFALMLNMTPVASLNVGMKCSRLTLQ